MTPHTLLGSCQKGNATRSSSKAGPRALKTGPWFRTRDSGPAHRPPFASDTRQPRRADALAVWHTQPAPRWTPLSAASAMNGSGRHTPPPRGRQQHSSTPEEGGRPASPITALVAAKTHHPPRNLLQWPHYQRQEQRDSSAPTNANSAKRSHGKSSGTQRSRTSAPPNPEYPRKGQESPHAKAKALGAKGHP